jgi:hypothetical protein
VHFCEESCIVFASCLFLFVLIVLVDASIWCLCNYVGCASPWLWVDGMDVGAMDGCEEGQWG